MPGIFSSLNSASAALQTHSRAVQQTGKNIANINNEHYSRQRLVVGSLNSVNGPFGVESGPLSAIGVVQSREVFIDRQILSEISYLETLENQEFRLRQIVANFGDNVDRSTESQFVDDLSATGGGLRGVIDELFNSFEAVASRPNDANSRQVLFQAAEELVNTFNRIDDRFELLEDELETQLDVDLAAFNQRVAELEEINREIGQLELAQPGSALDLRDQRQEKLEELSEYALIEVEDTVGTNGQITVSLKAEDGSLVPIILPSDGHRQVRFDQATGEFQLIGTSQVLNLDSGRLASTLEMRDQYVADVRQNIDNLANTVATQINELYYQAYVPAGANPAVPEASFFQMPTPPPSVSGVASTVTAASIQLYTTPSDPSVLEFTPLTADSLRTTDTELSGANELALALADLADQDNADLGSLQFSEYTVRVLTTLGQEVEETQNRVEVQENVMTLLRERRGEISGVSMDEEVSQMVQYQRAFQASSRFFNVLNQMLDEMLNSLGR